MAAVDAAASPTATSAAERTAPPWVPHKAAVAACPPVCPPGPSMAAVASEGSQASSSFWHRRAPSCCTPAWCDFSDFDSDSGLRQNGCGQGLTKGRRHDARYTLVDRVQGLEIRSTRACLVDLWRVFKPGLLVTAPGPTVDENDPTPFRHRGGLISHPPGEGGEGGGGCETPCLPHN